MVHYCSTGLQYNVGVVEGVELLSHLTAEERDSVLRTSAAGDAEDLEQFARSSSKLSMHACVRVRAVVMCTHSKTGVLPGVFPWEFP